VAAFDAVRRAYLRALGREPDAGGLQAYMVRVMRGAAPAEIEAELARSDEARARRAARGARRMSR
jgi:hypothetical protein